jgi:hypothetical protein
MWEKKKLLERKQFLELLKRQTSDNALIREWSPDQ